MGSGGIGEEQSGGKPPHSIESGVPSRIVQERQQIAFVLRRRDYQVAMRVVIQRVSQASVMIAGAIKATIQHGLLVLLAIEESDTAQDIEWLSGKIVRLADIQRWPRHHHY